MDTPEILEMERRLENWGAWARGEAQGGGKPNTCASAERLYRAPREDQERFHAGARESLDVRDAIKVEAAVVRLKRAPDRKFLIDWYVYRTHPYVMARIHKMPPALIVANVMRLVGGVFYVLQHQPAIVPLVKARAIEYGTSQHKNSTTA